MVNDMTDTLRGYLKTRDYYNALETIREELNIVISSHAEIEALLIYCIKRTQMKKENQDKTLMALNLLGDLDTRLIKGKSEEDRMLYSARRDYFLQNTNYIAKCPNYQSKTYEEAKVTPKSKSTGTELESIRGTLDKATARYVEEAIDFMYESKDINRLLTSAKDDLKKMWGDDNAKKISWSKWEHIPKELLPTLRYYEWVDCQAGIVSPAIIETDLDGGGNTSEGPDTSLRTAWERITHVLQKISDFTEKHMKILLLPIIAVSLIKIAFFNDYNGTGYQSEVKRTDSYTLPDSLPTVTAIKCTVPKVTIYPGKFTPLPIELDPPEAEGSYLLCDSSDNSILYGMGGSDVRVYALDDIGIDASSATVIVTVTPLNRASSDVAIEIPIEIDYDATMPKPVMSEEVIS